MSSIGDIWNFVANTKIGKGSGIAVFIFGTFFLIITERDYKRNRDVILEAESIVVEANDVSLPDAELDGKLIYGVSKIRTDDILADGLFEVKVNAVKLIRSVEYYQWVEVKQTESDKNYEGKERTRTVYTYERQWTDKPVDSEKFEKPQYRNRVIIEVRGMEKYADLVYWGAYELPLFLRSNVDGVTPVMIEISRGGKAAWENRLRESALKHNGQDSSSLADEYFHLFRANTVHLGANPASPRVGDMRATVTYIPPGRDLSVIAQVQGSTLAEYVSPKNGKSFHSVQNGVVSLEAMFKEEYATNTASTWAYRLIGFCFILFGLRCMFNLVTNLFAKIPVLGSIVNVGASSGCLFIGLVWSSIIVGVAFLFYRPLTGLIVLLVAVGLIWLLKKKGVDSSYRH